MAILKADVAFKRKVYILLLFIVVAGIILIQLGLPAFDEYLKNQKIEDALQTLLNALSLVLFTPFIMSIFIFQKGRRVLAVGQFPLPGTKVIKDTEILEGKLARRRAHIIIGLSIVLAIFSLFGAFYFPYGLKKTFYHKDKALKSNYGRQMGSVPLRSTSSLRP